MFDVAPLIRIANDKDLQVMSVPASFKAFWRETDPTLLSGLFLQQCPTCCLVLRFSDDFYGLTFCGMGKSTFPTRNPKQTTTVCKRTSRTVSGWDRGFHAKV